MSHYKLKTKYNTDGAYGVNEEKTIYAHHNLCNDYVTFYDENGGFIMAIPDTIDNNILDAINRLYLPFKDINQNFVDGVEKMTEEDSNKCGI